MGLGFWLTTSVTIPQHHVPTKQEDGLGPGEGRRVPKKLLYSLANIAISGQGMLGSKTGCGRRN